VVMPSVKTPESGDALTKAVEFLEAGAWQQAHEIVQAERSNLAAWLHGIVHTLEGDLDNARYWYRKTKRPEATGTLEAEWEAIAADLLARG